MEYELISVSEGLKCIVATGYQDEPLSLRKNFIIEETGTLSYIHEYRKEAGYVKIIVSCQNQDIYFELAARMKRIGFIEKYRANLEGLKQEREERKEKKLNVIRPYSLVYECVGPEVTRRTLKDAVLYCKSPLTFNAAGLLFLKQKKKKRAQQLREMKMKWEAEEK